ncbi:MAG: hypothetical protein ACO1QB_19265 [Verrucomicrobiales bacterium]
MKKMIRTAALLVALSTFAVNSAHALTTSQAKQIKQSVLTVPVPEMPAKAASLVISANKKDREAVAVTVVRAVAFKHRAAAPLVISAVSKAAPDVAPAIAAAATEVVRDQAVAIHSAATTAAPQQRVNITRAVNAVTASSTSAKPVTIASTKSGTTSTVTTTSTGSTVVSAQPLVRGAANYGGPSEGTIGTEGGTLAGTTPTTPPTPSSNATELDPSAIRE